MKSMKTEIEACLRANLETGLDTFLAPLGFTRRKTSLIYVRELAEAVQKIEVAVEIHPADRLDSAAAVYPWLEVTIDAVEKLVLEMVDGDVSRLAGLPSGTLREPIEFTSAKAAHARWFVFQPDSVLGIVGEMKPFLQQWTLPFLDLYSTPIGICEAYDRGDTRVINDLAQKLRVAAAMVLCGRTADAISVMDKWFGKPGPRKRYQRVFDHLVAKS